MANLIFDQQALLDGNIFKFENRLHSALNKYSSDNGMILTTYFALDSNATTVDRGLLEIEQVFGNKSPLRFNKIYNLPLLGFGQANPENTDEIQAEDILVNGECTILPSTIVPQPNDCFMINHLKMRALFQVTQVTYDSMKVDGFYKISYRLMETSEEAITYMNKQVIDEFNCDLNAIGTKLNPIIQKDDFITRERVIKMVNEIIDSYRGLFYNKRHNCFLFYCKETGYRLFDLCANSFISKYSLMNYENGTNVIMLHDKLHEANEEFLYNSSVYKWIERDTPKKFIQKFGFQSVPGVSYIDSSFYRWNEDDIMILLPSNPKCPTDNCKEFFDKDQILLFEDGLDCVNGYDTLISKFINNKLNSYKDIPLDIGDALFSSINDIDTFLYTPIIIYIIRKVLKYG